MTDLGTLGSSSSSEARGVSADGTVVVGADIGGSAVRWTQAEGWVDLGALGDSPSRSSAAGVSANGAVVVGGSGSFPDPNGNLLNHAFRWTASGGMVDLDTTTPSRGSFASAVSADGAVVVGSLNDEMGSRAYRWTETDGGVSLGTLGGPSVAYGVSRDGSVVIGEAAVADGTSHAFRWTASDGMVDLGTFTDQEGNEFTTTIKASGVSADGLVVVGSARTVSGLTRAFRWTAATGMQPLQDWLSHYGVAVPEGVTFLNASATNQDGSVVVGQLGNGHAFVARATPGKR